MVWAGAVLSAGLLELPFPLAGPMPAWRAVFAWFALVPLLCALLSRATVEDKRPLRRSFLIAYLCGVLWYVGNCYWVRDTMMRYGDMPTLAPPLLLLGYSMVLGLYFGFFGLGMAMVRRSTGSTRLALAVAPVLWTALELAGARITSVPWDQLGYSQVDNTLVNQLAPWTGVYGISFVLMAVNALIAGGLLLECCPSKRFQGRNAWAVCGALLLAIGSLGLTLTPQQAATTATAVLVQPNLDVAGDNRWNGPGEWNRQIAAFTKLAGEQCKSYIAGIPQTGAATGETVCPPNEIHPSLVVWPEAPSPFEEHDGRFEDAMAGVVRSVQAPLVVGGIGTDLPNAEGYWRYYNSAMFFAADGRFVDRYDKIHLVPFGEFIPFKDLLFFAHKLTGKVSGFTPGEERKVFRIGGHRYGVFICYEAVFADEVRHFSQLGAEVLVNISDDGWYGDTSAPWQHMNMARMRAIENRRWILRDTNSGVTAAIDPYGRVRQSIPRHAVDALPAAYGFRSDVTFYTAHGDVFAWLCAILAWGAIVWAMRLRLRLSVQIKSGAKS
jgi:apolipoprotein N-acyltransferase